MVTNKTQINQVWYKKQLYKSRTNRMATGLIGGVGEFIGVNATLLRLGYAAVTAFTGFFPGIVAYVIGSIIVPDEPRS